MYKIKKDKDSIYLVRKIRSHNKKLKYGSKGKNLVIKRKL